MPSECKDMRDDYIECLHHRKESERRAAIAKQIKLREEREKEEKAKLKLEKDAVN